MSEHVPLFEIEWGRAEVQNVIDSVTRGGYWAKGPYVDKFEEQLADYHDVKHAVVCNSGTTALTMALSALGIEEGDEVIVPSFTFIATPNAVKFVGGEPVFADIEEECLGLNPDSVKDSITDRTKAIIPVHYAGSPCRIHELARIADNHGIPVIEDAAEAQGAEVEGHPVGSIGEVGILSFCQNKIISTGEGGAILTNNGTVAREARLLRSHGRVPGNYFEEADPGTYVTLGNNYRMADICAALGVGQLNKIDHLIKRRRRLAKRYTDAFCKVEGVKPFTGHSKGDHVYQLYTIILEEKIDRSRVIKYLDEDNISTKVYFEPAHLSEFYRNIGHKPGELPVTENIASRVLSLPIYPTQSEETNNRVIDSFINALHGR